MKLDAVQRLGVGAKVIDWPSGGYAGHFGEGEITAIDDADGSVCVWFPDIELEDWFDPADLHPAAGVAT